MSMQEKMKKGLLTELRCELDFTNLGYVVSKPITADSRYDYIVDINGRLLKIQVKTSSLSDDGGYMKFASSTSHTNTKGTVNKSYTADEIDYFATMYNGECYIVPIERCGCREQRLRLLPTKNGQTVGITFAKDFKLKDTF